jgi:hypothetical protein
LDQDQRVHILKLVTPGTPDFSPKMFHVEHLTESEL